jgi:CheY-like chemotaxis protein
LSKRRALCAGIRRGSIRFSATYEAAPANTAVVRVRDDGEGIATELLPRIFDLFVQGDESAADLGSAGIGLALARQLVALYGGTIEARSAGALKGSEFVVRFPVAEPHAAPRALLAVGTAQAGLARRVLIVDDNRDFAQTQAALLQLSGHVVHVTADGASALVAAGEFAPDVVLLDLGLEEGDAGYAVAEKLRRANPGIPAIVAVSGMDRQQDFERSRAAGFDYHLTKPVDAEKSDKDEGDPARDRSGGE